MPNETRQDLKELTKHKNNKKSNRRFWSLRSKKNSHTPPDLLLSNLSVETTSQSSNKSHNHEFSKTLCTCIRYKRTEEHVLGAGLVFSSSPTSETILSTEDVQSNTHDHSNESFLTFNVNSQKSMHSDTEILTCETNIETISSVIPKSDCIKNFDKLDQNDGIFVEHLKIKPDDQLENQSRLSLNQATISNRACSITPSSNFLSDQGPKEKNYYQQKLLGSINKTQGLEEEILGLDLHSSSINLCLNCKASHAMSTMSCQNCILSESLKSITDTSILNSVPPAPSCTQKHKNIVKPVYNYFGSSQPLQNVTVHTQIDYVHFLVPDLNEITKCLFYWGIMDRYEAEKLLENRPEGSFLLRDSAQEEFLFSVSFRRYGRSLHARIEQWNHQFSFDSHDPGVFSADSVTKLIEHYKEPESCMFFEPMLSLPLHRSFPFQLQHLCRSVITTHIVYDSINKLNLPKSLKEYLQYYHYKQKVRVRRFDCFSDS